MQSKRREGRLLHAYVALAASIMAALGWFRYPDEVPEL